MCVIVAVEKDGNRPSPEHVDTFWEKNPHGAGIAWFDGKKDERKVVFQKGLTLNEIQDLIKIAPLPFVAHFRIETCGGVLKRLTHPFIISETSPLTLKGSTSDPVLFHNGVWENWERRAVDICTYTGRKLPEGPWSDSRLMAWFAAGAGIGVIDLIAAQKQRIVTLTPATGLLHLAGEWEEIDKDEGGSFWVSNLVWKTLYASRGKKINPQEGAGKKASQSQPVPQTTGGSALSLVDPRVTVMGPTQRPTPGLISPQAISHAASSASKDGPAEAKRLSLGDPFPVNDLGLPALKRLQNLEKVWISIQEQRMRHAEGMTKTRFKSLKNLYHRRRDEIMGQMRKEMIDEAKMLSTETSTPSLTGLALHRGESKPLVVM